ncbi:MAG TPA: molybdopterin-binding protein, partial [Candidatus Tumulicola sp.]|nr:molybdopterin-binding protein [Candidatus Tumulicola sp.]
MEKRAITRSANALLPGSGFVEQKLTSPRAALDAFFARVSLQPRGVETVSVERAFGRVLARDAVAPADAPAAARSAMDGFALRAACAPGEFAIAGEVRMGEGPGREVAAGEALRIPTGGTLPHGADAVVPIEQARCADSRLYVADRIGAGENVIAAGADVRRGETVVCAGTRIGSAHAGALAALGFAEAAVFVRPVFGVLSSGDELVPAGSAAPPGAVFDSNRYAIAASLEAMGALPRHYPIAGDEPGECERALHEALRDCDGVAITGGSSVG